jgi:hypothetical protein
MVSFEMASEKILQLTGKSKDALTGGQQMGVNLTGGLIAGMAAAVISQPADTLLSKINKSKGAPGQSTTSRLIQMSGQLGLKGLFTGMSARLVMIGTLTAGQCRSCFPLSMSLLLIHLSLHLRRYQEGPQRHRWCRDCCYPQVDLFLPSFNLDRHQYAEYIVDHFQSVSSESFVALTSRIHLINLAIAQTLGEDCSNQQRPFLFSNTFARLYTFRWNCLPANPCLTDNPLSRSHPRKPPLMLIHNTQNSTDHSLMTSRTPFAPSNRRLSLLGPGPGLPDGY